MANNDDQIAEWNGPMGERWAKMQGELDALTRPFGDAALRARAVATRWTSPAKVTPAEAEATSWAWWRSLMARASVAI